MSDWEEYLNTPVNLHVLDFLGKLPEDLIQCVVTSPPYYGLRAYAGNQIRIWPPLQDTSSGDCDHDWGDKIETHRSHRHGQDGSGLRFSEEKMDAMWEEQPPSQFCLKCGAWKGALGSEPDLELFIDHLVLIFRGIRRVLRKDGIVWLNMGDSYYGGNQPFSDSSKIRAHIEGGRGVVKHGKHPIMKTKDLMGVPWKLAFALQKDGWFLRSAFPWLKDNPMPDNVSDRPGVAHEYFFLLTKSPTTSYWINNEEGRGSRVKPEAVYRYKDKLEDREYSVKPEGGFRDTKKIICPECNGNGEIKKQVNRDLEGNLIEKTSRCMKCKGKGSFYRWTKRNMWRGRDYFYDSETTRINGVMPPGVVDKRTWKPHFDDQKINTHRSNSISSGTRFRRTSDWFLDSLNLYIQHLQRISKNGGLLDSPEGIPLALYVNTKPHPEAHFAVFPEELVEPCLKTGSPPRSCSSCGAPWEYQIEVDKAERNGYAPSKTGFEDGWRPEGSRGNEGFNAASTRKVIGSFPTCDCGSEPVPPIVFDPFLGSGTVGVVAEKLGRRWLGCDISEEYCEIAGKRLREGRSKRIQTLSARSTSIFEF